MWLCDKLCNKFVSWQTPRPSEKRQINLHYVKKRADNKRRTTMMVWTHNEDRRRKKSEKSKRSNAIQIEKKENTQELLAPIHWSCCLVSNSILFGNKIAVLEFWFVRSFVKLDNTSPFYIIRNRTRKRFQFVRNIAHKHMQHR